MAFDPALLDEIRTRVPLTAVIGRRTKLVRSGRNWKACCPFHGEKTPSFYVYDDHFHCFGCGVHGDVISFVMQSEGRSFPEAVEQLANEAGLEVPRQDPRSEARAREAQSLGDVLQLVQGIWRRKLLEREGRDGLSYLKRRGLTDATIEAFGLGWSGDGRGGLVEELRGHGVPPEALLHAGLMRVDEHGAAKGELFFSRVTFPIRDRRGRIVSFGGRTLGDGQPKYLNGPETALFSKRRTLFNLDRARQSAREPGQNLIVVEGYMDVIALHQAGFHAAVAPLGTAMGAEQIEMLWQVLPEPVLCLDGDAAGSRAALRAAETALPLLKPDRTLRFCRLPESDDPDSFVRREGPDAMRRVIEGATSLADELFSVVAAGIAQRGPEQRAGIRARLEALAAQITDRALASEFRRTLLERFFSAVRPAGRKSGDGRGRVAARGPVARTLPPDGALERLRAMTALLLRYPEHLPELELPFSSLELPADLDGIREAMLNWLAEQPHGVVLTSEGLDLWLGAHHLAEQKHALLSVGLPRLPCGPDDTAFPETGPLQRWWECYGLENLPAFRQGVMEEVRSALSDPTLTAWPEGLNARMRAMERLSRGESADEGLAEEG